mmetsp:Transcript_26062/g.72874  ORF Transcript_26062/g.72874 Transcript_26062/m.72874 type:complete len:255 (+) Transcript_26062:635-1399(+)
MRASEAWPSAEWSSGSYISDVADSCFRVAMLGSPTRCSGGWLSPSWSWRQTMEGSAAKRPGATPSARCSWLSTGLGIHAREGTCLPKAAAPPLSAFGGGRCVAEASAASRAIRACRAMRSSASMSRAFGTQDAAAFVPEAEASAFDAVGGLTGAALADEPVAWRPATCTSTAPCDVSSQIEACCNALEGGSEAPPVTVCICASSGALLLNALGAEESSTGGIHSPGRRIPTCASPWIAAGCAGEAHSGSTAPRI